MPSQKSSMDYSASRTVTSSRTHRLLVHVVVDSPASTGFPSGRGTSGVRFPGPPRGNPSRIDSEEFGGPSGNVSRETSPGARTLRRLFRSRASHSFFFSKTQKRTSGVQGDTSNRPAHARRTPTKALLTRFGSCVCCRETFHVSRETLCQDSVRHAAIAAFHVKHLCLVPRRGVASAGPFFASVNRYWTLI